MAGVLQHERLDKPLPRAGWGDRADNTEVLPPLDPHAAVAATAG